MLAYVFLKIPWVYLIQTLLAFDSTQNRYVFCVCFVLALSVLFCVLLLCCFDFCHEKSELPIMSLVWAETLIVACVNAECHSTCIHKSTSCLEQYEAVESSSLNKQESGANCVRTWWFH
jgi:hypothetical protein